MFIFLHSSNVSTSSRLLLRFLGNLWAALSQNPSLRLEPATCTDRNTRKAPATTSILFRTACLRAHRKKPLSSYMKTRWRVVEELLLWLWFLHHSFTSLTLCTCPPKHRYQFNTSHVLCKTVATVFVEMFLCLSIWWRDGWWPESALTPVSSVPLPFVLSSSLWSKNLIFV